MGSPFPGMDPYLEDQDIWRGFHHYLADDIATALNARLSERYFADVEVRSTIEEIDVETRDVYPDAIVVEVASPLSSAAPAAVAIPEAPIQRTATVAIETKLRAVHIYVTKTRRLVTSIELLSPANKRGDGLIKYRRKRRKILLSTVHLIEIDLVRGGQRPGNEVNEPPLDTDYVLLVNRANDSHRRISEIWPVALNEPLPTLPVPLLEPDPDIPLDMTQIVNTIYMRAVYARRIDYSEPVPPPKLRPPMEHWWAEQQQAGRYHREQPGNDLYS
ncbi:MAG TPA: DUF4058 family protein [Caldilineaceae bacterium]|nr:DUF4058 family protein [Caldilineaceae bacterium]